MPLKGLVAYGEPYPYSLLSELLVDAKENEDSATKEHYAALCLASNSDLRGSCI